MIAANQTVSHEVNVLMDGTSAGKYFLRKMKSILLCFTVLLFFAPLCLAAPAGDQSSAVTESSDETPQKESKLDQWYQKFLNAMKIKKKSGATTNLTEETPLTLLDLPRDVWANRILPQVPDKDAVNLRQANNQFKSIADMRATNFSSVVKACGDISAGVFKAQQTSADYQDEVSFNINDQYYASRAQACVWATRNWVESLDRPQPIRLEVSIGNAIQHADFFFYNNLFKNTEKVRFVVSVSVGELNEDLERNIRAISQQGSIQKLRLYGDRLEDTLAAKLASLLKKKTSIRQLHLSFRQISLKGAVALAGLLNANTDLSKLVSEAAFKNENSKKQGLKALAKALMTNSRLQELILKNTEMGDAGAKTLADALKYNTALRFLGLKNNDISREGAEVLSDILRSSKLKALDMSFNHIGAQGIHALISHTKLKKLVVSHNAIYDRDAGIIADALKFNTDLQVLSMKECYREYSGAAILAEALKDNKALLELDLESNRIGNEGALAFAEALKQNTNLKVLNLIGNGITATGEKQLATGLKANSSLTIWVARHTFISGEDAKALLNE